MLGPYLAFKDLKGYQSSWLRNDVLAAMSVTCLALPQGMAYAMVAGLPPVVGLYSAAIPVMICSFLRSSPFVISGRTNALSLVVALGVAAAVEQGLDPLMAAAILALLVGLMQILAGALRLGALVDYISGPVVSGYITGAALLIGLGQLHHLTGTTLPAGAVWMRLLAWIESLPEANMITVLIGLGTALAIVVLRQIPRLNKLPHSLLVISLGLLVVQVFDLQAKGVQTIADLGALGAGLPAFSFPGTEHAGRFLALAFAATVLSLVESTSVARSVGAGKGERLNASTEFFGQGCGNIVAAFCSGYPISGSPSRTAFNISAGAKSRLSGVFSGIFVLLIVVVGGSAFNSIPIASFAGLLLVLAYELIDFRKIRFIWQGNIADRLAFFATLTGALVMSLDKAIYLGVLISIVYFLRRARILRVEELAVGPEGELLEVHELGDAYGAFEVCPNIKIVNVEGSLFFGAAGELSTELAAQAAAENVSVIVLRLNRTSGMDLTVIQMLVEFAERLEKRNCNLILAGVRLGVLSRLERTGALDMIGRENVCVFRPRFLEDIRNAVGRALEHCGNHGCEKCPLLTFVDESLETSSH